MSEVEKKIPQWGFYGHRNSKVDLASFEKISDDEFVFTKKNFWGFEDFSKRYSLNASQRNKILKSYRWCWTGIGIILFLCFFGSTRAEHGGIGCYLTSLLCEESCIFVFSIPFSLIFYRIFVVYNNSKIISSYPIYKGETTILYKKCYVLYGIIFTTLISGLAVFAGIKCILDKIY